VLQRVGGDGEQLRVPPLELRDPVPQLREVLSAERSHEAAQEDQDHWLPAQGGEAHLLTAD
jgi:hypothetical protein